MVSDTKIFVTFQKEGIHRYPAAATKPELEEVAFLANPHRHVFHFRVEMEVFHDDRDVEFIILKRELETLYSDKMNIDYKSCEMLARELLTYLESFYGGRSLSVTVSEDGENGATVSYAPPRETKKKSILYNLFGV